jgi:CRISPR-associated protein Csb2
MPTKSLEDLLAELENARAGRGRQVGKQKKSPVEGAEAAIGMACQAAVSFLPEHRTRKPRTFPTVVPENPVVHFFWNDSTGEARNALESLASRVSYLGHSSSLVAVSVETKNLPAPTHEPSKRGRWRLRCFGTNQLKALDDAYAVNERLGNKPEQSYRLPKEDVSYDVVRPASASSYASRNVFGSDWIAFRRVGGPELPIRAVLDVTHALRCTVKRLLEKQHVSPRALEVITGLTPNGLRLEVPHLAWLALPHVNHLHATGRLMGAAIVLPSFLGEQENAELADEVLRSLDLGSQLEIQGIGYWRIEQVRTGDVGTTLDPGTWCQPARRWATVTPLVLDRFPGHLHGRAARTLAELDQVEHSQRDAEQSVKTACTRIGLPEPLGVHFSKISPVYGTLPSAAYPPLHAFRPPPTRPGTPRRWHVHALVEFAEPVSGPLLIGAGRYLGYGLCCPMA